MRDELMEYDRPVIIALHQNIGRYVKIQLIHDSRWLMISEVHFESSKCYPGNKHVFKIFEWGPEADTNVEALSINMGVPILKYFVVIIEIHI